MATMARWIRLRQDCPARLRAAPRAFARAQPDRAAPAVLWARDADGGFAYALVVPRAAAPGHRWRWPGWALAAAVATYRGAGERAYLDGDEIRVGGRRLAGCDADAVGGCAVLASRFPPRAGAGWSERAVETAFRERLEAQHGWQFDNSWPTAAETAAMAGALGVEATGAA